MPNGLIALLPTPVGLVAWIKGSILVVGIKWFAFTLKDTPEFKKCLSKFSIDGTVFTEDVLTANICYCLSNLGQRVVVV